MFTRQRTGQNRVVARNTRTLLLKEVISIRFDQNLPQGKNWPIKDRIRQNTEDGVEVRTEVFSLCVVITVRSYSYSKNVLQLTLCSSAWWISNKSTHPMRNPSTSCRVTRIRDIVISNELKSPKNKQRIKPTSTKNKLKKQFFFISYFATWQVYTVSLLQMPKCNFIFNEL
jgi:hypothetical protein